MEPRSFPALSPTQSRGSAPSTPKSSHIATLPESPTSPLAPRSSSPARPIASPTASRAPSQLRVRESRPPYLPFRRISLPAVPNNKRDSVASIFTVDSVQEREEHDDVPHGMVSASLPTESSMPDMNPPLSPPPPIPIAGSSATSSPSRRVILLAPTSPPVTPSRVRPKSTRDTNRVAGTSQGRSVLVKRSSRRGLSRTHTGERNKEREEKRANVLRELLDTEQTYVEGLDLVYDHFLAPLIESLTSPNPLLTHSDLQLIFPGFIDILNFNHSFLADLRSALSPAFNNPTDAIPIPNVSSTSLAGPSFPNEAAGLLLRAPAELSGSPSSFTNPFPPSASHAASSSHVYLASNANLSSSILEEDTQQENVSPPLPNLAPLLAQHVPYLKLYKPFVTAFPASMERLAKLSANESFRVWLRDKERDPACGMLGLRSWLLTVVQRCPRYLMLVKDLVKHAGEEDEGYQELVEVLALLTKITGSLNTSLADHTAVLALLDLQRNTTNLPPGFSVVAPGRALLRRGRLRMSGQEVMRISGRREVIRRVVLEGEDSGEREVLLFSDCVVWLEREREWGISSSAAAGVGAGAGVRHSAVGIGRPSGAPRRPTMGRTRSKSEAELPTLRSTGSVVSEARAVSGSSSAFVSSANGSSGEGEERRPIEGLGLKGRGSPFGDALRRPGGQVQQPSGGEVPRRPVAIPEHGSSTEDRWRFRGRAGLMDVEVVISPRNALQIDFLSPERSFALYASSYDEREEWIGAIRSAKATLLATFNVTHPDSTLTSSSSTTHLRRVLQALPYPPGEATIRGARNGGTTRRTILRKGKTGRRQGIVLEENEDPSAEDEAESSGRSVLANETKRKERRGRVEHFVPAIWVPDHESAVCMRCQSAFGWRRRRHHCRLCGRVVCAACSQKSFFIMDPANADAPKSHKPERACSLCYDTVFPVLHSSSESLGTSANQGGETIMPTRSSSARPRILQHLISTSPVTTPAVERASNGMLASPSTAGMGTSPSPSGVTILSSASSRSNNRSPRSPPTVTFASPPDMTSSTTARTVTSFDSQRTVQPRPTFSSDLSSLTSDSNTNVHSDSRPRSLDIGRRWVAAAASALVHTTGVTARTKATGRGKSRRVSLVSGRRVGGEGPAGTSAGGSSVGVGIGVGVGGEGEGDGGTLGRGAAAQQLSELLGRNPK